jgi:hypothetical protein
MRLASFVLLFALSFAVHAQAPGDEFGVRYWYSEGRTTRSHNAQGVDPTVGNPTSVLTWTELEAHALELHGRKNLGQGGFLKGYAGFGNIRGGSLRDEDFNVGQVKSSDTTSNVKADSLTYASIDFGTDLWRFRNGKAGIFIGYQFWREQVDAYGVVRTVAPPGRPLGVIEQDSVLVIGNEVTWQSLRLGFAGEWNLSAPTRITLDAAFVPYAHGRDEDSHFLRQSRNDLGPVPNIHSNGNGYGVQLDAELRHLVQRDWEFGVGLRYWWLRARDGEHQQAGFDLQLLELESQRFGLTLSLTHRW